MTDPICIFFFYLALYQKMKDLSKLQAFVDHKVSGTKMRRFALGRIENFVEKGENVGFQLGYKYM